MKPTYNAKTPRAAIAALAVAATVMVGLSIEGLARYTADHATQASLPAPQVLASSK